MSHSWWEIQQWFVDATDDYPAPKKFFYSHIGRPLKAPPYAQAMKAYKKHWAQEPDEWKSDDPD
jgi:hypothetical protein